MADNVKCRMNLSQERFSAERQWTDRFHKAHIVDQSLREWNLFLVGNPTEKTQVHAGSSGTPFFMFWRIKRFRNDLER